MTSTYFRNRFVKPYIKLVNCFLSSSVGSLGYEAAIECNKDQVFLPISCFVNAKGFAASSGVNKSPIFFFLLMSLY